MRELRIQCGLSQEKLALYAGITPAYLGLVERGKRNATVVTIERLCDAMNVSLAEFFSPANNAPPLEDSIGQQILHQLKGLTVMEQEGLLRLIKDLFQIMHMNERKLEENYGDCDKTIGNF